MTQIDQDLLASLYALGFNFLGGDLFNGEIAEIKGDMIIKLVHPLGEELKFVVTLPGGEQMIFSVDRHQIVNLADHQHLTRTVLADQARDLGSRRKSSPMAVDGKNPLPSLVSIITPSIARLSPRCRHIIEISCAMFATLVCKSLSDVQSSK